MSRLPFIQKENFTSDQQRVFEHITGGKRSGLTAIKSWFNEEGGLRGPFNAFLYSHALGDAAQSLGEAVRFESSIPPALQELAILTVAAKWKTQYEFWAHAKIGRKEGLSENVLDSIKAGKPPDFTNPAEAVVYAFVRELIDTYRVSDHKYAEVVNLLGESGAVELVITAGYFTMISMLLNVCEVPLPPGEKPPFAGVK